MNEIPDLPTIPLREPESHKGTFGHVLVLGGSLGMTGAPVLASLAALRAGAGLVTCACPAHVQPVIATKLTEAMSWPLPIDQSGCLSEEAQRVLRGAAGRYEAAVVGPGLGRQEATRRFVRSLLSEIDIPTVVDADALVAFDEGLASRDNLILTPHPGEFAAMAGTTAAEVQADRLGGALAFVAQNGGVLVLKGHGSIVASRDGYAVNLTGNPGMATAGAGDVLSGIIGALAARGFSPFAAARLGVWLHGRAGDLALAEFGEEGLIAGDIIAYLPAAIRERKAGQPKGPKGFGASREGRP